MTTRFKERIPPQNLSKKQLKQWTQQEGQRLQQIQNQFIPVDDDFISKSPFGKRIGLVLGGVGLLNSLPNVICEPL
jgi:hypothetical protein